MVNIPDFKPIVSMTAVAMAVAKGAFGKLKEKLKKTNPLEANKELINKSETLKKNIADLEKDGWEFKYGEKGKGSFCDKAKKQIVLDPTNTSSVSQVQTLAHETGHALYDADAYVPPGSLTKKQYVAKNANRHLKDEGEATLVNAQIRDEIITAGGPDIGIAGTNQKKYSEAYDRYEISKDRDKARQEIADIFADGENPSTDPTKTYREYYSETYSKHWDKIKP